MVILWDKIIIVSYFNIHVDIFNDSLCTAFMSILGSFVSKTNHKPHTNRKTNQESNAQGSWWRRTKMQIQLSGTSQSHGAGTAAHNNKQNLSDKASCSQGTPMVFKDGSNCFYIFPFQEQHKKLQEVYHNKHLFSFFVAEKCEWRFTLWE